MLASFTPANAGLGLVMTEPLRGVVFDVQRFSVHDGPGLRTTVFLKGCPLRCRWCQNPESLRHEPELSVAVDRCMGCGQCADACPQRALDLGPGQLDRTRCDLCGACVPGCPAEALSIVGRKVTAHELACELETDRAFFAASAGGVTLSGGEPTAQPAFCAALVAELAARSIPVGLETCGLFRWSAVEPWLAALEFIYVDLKIMDSDLHRASTGAGNERIVDNVRAMLALRLPVHFRVPVVPGQTDGRDNLDAVATFLRACEVGRVTLLRYHRMGEAKIPRIDAPLVPLGIDGTAAAEQSFARAREQLTRLGLEVLT